MTDDLAQCCGVCCGAVLLVFLLAILAPIFLLCPILIVLVMAVLGLILIVYAVNRQTRSKATMWGEVVEFPDEEYVTRMAARSTTYTTTPETAARSVSGTPTYNIEQAQQGQPRQFQSTYRDPNSYRFIPQMSQRGEFMRSKSEVIIANMLYSKGLDYEYERVFQGQDKRTVKPDFTLEDSDSGVLYLWEHCGMMSDPNYREKWDRKLLWYRSQQVLPIEEGGGRNGTLITTFEDENQGINSQEIVSMIETIFGFAL